VTDGEAVAPEHLTQAKPSVPWVLSRPSERSDERKNIAYDGRMIGIPAIILGLVYLGRLLMPVWAQTPLGPDELAFLVPLIIAALALWYSRARNQRRRETSPKMPTPKRQPVPQPAYGDVLDNWLFEVDDAKPIEGSGRADREKGDAQRLSEDFFHGRYHWWGNR
jgi:hypothetical protein